MISNQLQYRIHLGDRDAFCQLFSAYGREVYLTALEELGDPAAARNAAKQVFLRLQRELRAATGPMDVETRIGLLAKAEIANAAAAQDAAAQPLRTWDTSKAAPNAASQPSCPESARKVAATTASQPPGWLQASPTPNDSD